MEVLCSPEPLFLISSLPLHPGVLKPAQQCGLKCGFYRFVAWLWLLEEEMEKIALLRQDQSRGSETTDNTSFQLCPSVSAHLPSRQPIIRLLHYEDRCGTDRDLRVLARADFYGGGER